MPQSKHTQTQFPCLRDEHSNEKYVFPRLLRICPPMPLYYCTPEDGFGNKSFRDVAVAVPPSSRTEVGQLTGICRAGAQTRVTVRGWSGVNRRIWNLDSLIDYEQLNFTRHTSHSYNHEILTADSYASLYRPPPARRCPTMCAYGGKQFDAPNGGGLSRPTLELSAVINCNIPTRSRRCCSAGRSSAGRHSRRRTGRTPNSPCRAGSGRRSCSRCPHRRW